ncbi:MAG: alkene reductase [Phycisphaerales bacterium]
MPDLFSPLDCGSLRLPNRILMAPCTRCRAGTGNAPTALNARYYAQRASAGLLITEATQVCPEGAGYPNTPGMYSAEQVAGWRLVTDAVHAAGGRIFAQLWHVGRVSHGAYQPGGAAPVSSWAAAKSGQVTLPDYSSAPYPTPRALETDEVPKVIEQFRHGARCAKEAGFDGVELHGANGYLPDQFLRDGVNRRSDRYGGSIEHRARFHLEAAEALCEVFGAGRVGVRLSPSGTFNDMRDSTPRETFGYLVSKLGEMNLAYLHIMEAMESDLKHGREIDAGYEPIPVSFFRPLFKGTLITNAGFSFEKATTYIKEGWADAVAFGVMFIANPDLPDRFRRLAAGETNVTFNTPDPATFYTGGEKGYTDYPMWTR